MFTSPRFALFLGLLSVACVAVACGGGGNPTPLPVSSEALLPGAPAPGDSQESGQTPWVRERVEAVIRLYNIAPAGQQWMRGYDLRQMVGQPGWFGSLGYDSWAGVGQAIPHIVLHELSHSYYGAFPISGRADLAWQKSPGQEVSPALAQYHSDLATFMAQPPDSYEPLRERFRNLPNLSKEEDPDLFHLGEAGLMYMTAANLNLAPPILRKYFDQLIQEGEVQTWREAITWYLGLSDDDKKVADRYIGIPHFPLGRYRALKPEERTHLPPHIQDILQAEERQRLVDFAQQFDLIKANEFSLVDAAAIDRGFEFWRNYLREMRDLHKKHPEILEVVPDSRRPQLRRALDTFIQAEKLSEEEQADFFGDKMGDPLLLDFMVLLKAGTLVELFGEAEEDGPIESLEGVINRYSRKLASYAKEMNAVLEVGRKNPDKAARRLEKFLGGLSDEQQDQDLAVIFDLLRDSDRVVAKNVANRMSDQAILRMLENKASAVRNNIGEERLLLALKITPQHELSDIAAGIRKLLDETSGNFQIDRPFTNMAFRVIADVGERNFQDGLFVVGESGIPLVDFVGRFPEEAVAILSSNVEEAARLVSNLEGFAHAPWGIVHAIIFAEPELAGRIVVELGRQSSDALVAESLIVFAFDAERKAANPDLRISLEKDLEFVEYLVDTQGPQWVQGYLEAALRKYNDEVRRNRIDADFIVQYRATLQEMFFLEPDPDVRASLEQVFNRAYEGTGLYAL